MEKKVYKITESELHDIIKESVNQIIKEQMINEGLRDTIRSFVGQYGKRGADKAQEIGTAVGKQFKQGVDKAQEMGKAVGKQFQKGYDAVQQGYTNVKNDIEQTAKNARKDSAMKDMQKAFQNFKAAVEKFKQNGGQVNGQLNSRIVGIEKMMGGYQAHF